MSARPVVKTSYMDAAMQDVAITAAQVRIFHLRVCCFACVIWQLYYALELAVCR